MSVGQFRLRRILDVGISWLLTGLSALWLFEHFHPLPISTFMQLVKMFAQSDHYC